MKRFRDILFPSLARKIAGAVSLVLLLAGGTFVYFAQKTGYTMLEQQAEIKAHGIADLMNGIIDHAMLEGQALHVRHALDVASSTPYVTNAYILRNDGSMILQARVESSLVALPIDHFRGIEGMKGEKFLSSRENGSMFEYIITPIQKKPECYQCHAGPERQMGFFALKLPIDDIRSVASQHRTMNIVMTVATFGGLGGIIFFALTLLVIRPIRRLHSHIRSIEDSVRRLAVGEQMEFPLLPPPQTNDEIADLCGDFNELVSRLNEANARLHDMHLSQLEQADRLAATGQMAASIAHEIKNPIAGVLGAVQVFQSETSDNDERKEILSEMIVQLERVNHAVNDLLGYARPTPPVFEQVDVNSVVHKTLSLLSQQMKGKDLAIHLKLSDDSTIIPADRKQFQQVLWNIILNGMQSMESGGTLTVTTVRSQRGVDILVGDTGVGIPADRLKDVFKPFFSTKHKGTGLGMTISRRIVHQHGGSIEISSMAGKGTTVTISMPHQHLDV